MDYRIACIIVTYNRKELLEKCLFAVNNQIYKPFAVYIFDNASTDGTIDLVKSLGFYNTNRDGIQYKYFLNAKNEGGAGGFYKGMKTAFEDDDYDALWVMDDDGEPESSCLEKLVPYLGTKDYIAPLVVSVEDGISCAFKPGVSIAEFQASASNGIVDNWASPFNGILYSKRLINKIGYPKPELFIWGDEVNYHWRALNEGMVPITVVDALHYHPKCKDVFVKTVGNRDIIFVPQKWKGYCQYRNVTYNCWHVHPEKSVMSKIHSSLVYFYLHSYYFLFIKHSLSWQLCFTKAMFAGIFAKFGGQYKYMK